jgi:hypothetical protein
VNKDVFHGWKWERETETREGKILLKIEGLLLQNGMTWHKFDSGWYNSFSEG